MTRASDRILKVIRANRARYEQMEMAELRELVAYINGTEPELLEAILADFEIEWA